MSQAVVRRRTLSGNLVAEKIIFFLLLACVLIFGIKHYPQLLFIAGPIFIVLEYLIYYLPDKLAFDNECLFIKRKKGEEQVALKDIYLVRTTALNLGFKTIYKIKYSSRNGAGVTRFYPKSKPCTNDFITLLKTANPRAEIRI